MREFLISFLFLFLGLMHVGFCGHSFYCYFNSVGIQCVNQKGLDTIEGSLVKLERYLCIL